METVHRWAANTVLNNKKDIIQYSSVRSCRPNCTIWRGSPPLVMLIVIFTSVIVWLASLMHCFIYKEVDVSYSVCVNYLHKFEIDRVCDFIIQEFIWDPYQTSSVWRYFLYALNSINFGQLILNLVVYIFIGVPFEMVFGSGRTCILLSIVTAMGALMSSVIIVQGFIVGGSVIAQFFMFSALTSRLIQSFGKNKSQTLGFSYLYSWFIIVISIFDFLHMRAHFNQTKLEPRETIAKIKLSYIPTVVGAIYGLITGSVIMTGYRRLPVRQICLETSIYVMSFGIIIIMGILKIINVIKGPSCKLDYPSNQCAPLGCQFLGQNQEI